MTGIDASKLDKLKKLFLIFFKIGAFTFGGGYAMLPLMQKEVVDRQKWMKEEEILDVFAIAQSVPGVIAINSSIFIGKRVAGTSGAISAALGVILPSFTVILVLASLLIKHRDNEILDKIFTGIRAASAALILLAAIKMAKKAVTNKWGAIIAIIAFTIIVVFDVHAIWAVIIGASYGIINCLYRGRAEK
ncbi:MAG: chromate transporter [Clostridiaceae bacterium]|nr:chromate transporter [Clostridiaceae bacterium]